MSAAPPVKLSANQSDSESYHEEKPLVETEIRLCMCHLNFVSMQSINLVYSIDCESHFLITGTAYLLFMIRHYCDYNTFITEML